MSVQIALAAEVERLRHDIERYIAIASEHATECERLRTAEQHALSVVRAQQETIDRLSAELAAFKREIADALSS